MQRLLIQNIYETSFFLKFINNAIRLQTIKTPGLWC